MTPPPKTNIPSKKIHTRYGFCVLVFLSTVFLEVGVLFMGFLGFGSVLGLCVRPCPYYNHMSMVLSRVFLFLLVGVCFLVVLLFWWGIYFLVFLVCSCSNRRGWYGIMVCMVRTCIIPGCINSRFYSLYDLCETHDTLHSNRHYIEEPSNPNIVYIPLSRYKPKAVTIIDSYYKHVAQWRYQLSSNGYATLATTRTQYRNNTGLHQIIMHTTHNKTGLIVDHINRDRLDNRHENLRLVTNQTNIYNSDYSDNSGITQTQYGTYSAHLYYNQHKYYIGSYPNRQQAYNARITLKTVLATRIDQQPDHEWIKQQIHRIQKHTI